MLPAYTPNPVAVLGGGGRPIDGGRTLSDGRRILGDGKTYRGFGIGVAGGVVVGLVQVSLEQLYGWEWLPQQTVLSVVLLSLGALLGDLVKSFWKRRMGLERGASWPGADQYDLVAGALLLVGVFDPGWILSWFSWPVLVMILVITPILHRLTNWIGFRIGYKEVPW